MLEINAINMFLSKFGKTAEVRKLEGKNVFALLEKITLENLEDIAKIMRYNANGSVYMPIVEEYDLEGHVARCGMVLVNYKEDLLGLYLGIGYSDTPRNGTMLIINEENLGLLYPLD
jgi:hypothetical protein